MSIAGDSQDGIDPIGWPNGDVPSGQSVDRHGE